MARAYSYCDACGMLEPHACALELELRAAQTRVENWLATDPRNVPVTVYCERCGYWVDAAHDCPALRPTEPAPVVVEMPGPRGDAAHGPSVATPSRREECGPC